MNIFPTDEERGNPEIKNLFLGKKSSVDGVGTSIPIVDGPADDDFVEPPPQSVASGSLPRLPRDPKSSVSLISTRMKALESRQKKLEEGNKIIIKDLSSLKTFVEESFSKFQDLLISHMHMARKEVCSFFFCNYVNFV